MSKAEGQEKQLKQEFSSKQLKAANLEPLTEQLGEMKQSLGAMLRLLPSKTEIEGLLVDISQSGLAAGLEFELFKPKKEAKEDFYAVQPIDIRVTGEYQQFASFIEAVAALPRIVTQHDLRISPKGELLSMQLEARTYRYLDEEELAEIAEQKVKIKEEKETPASIGRVIVNNAFSSRGFKIGHETETYS